MCKFWLVFCVITTQIRFITGYLPKAENFRKGMPKEKEVRLVGGNSLLEGRIEIWYNNRWGTVCDDEFDSKDAAVICHMLGFERLGARPYTEAAYGQGRGIIWLDELKCYGDELSVKDCPHYPWGSHDCSHTEDAGVKCQAKQITFEHDMAVEWTEKYRIPDRYMSYQRNAVKDPSKHWKDNIVYYMFGVGIESKTKDLIRDALEEWSLYSCIDFKRDETMYNKIVFISEEHETKCGSISAGMKQGSQEIHLGKDCLHLDVILHEVGHALGFYHEHNRADRDKYIKIHYENIIEGKEYSFDRMDQTEYEDYGKPYDYKSIMHYGQYSFSKIEKKGLITIETLDTEFQDVIGKAKHPSYLDYKILNTMYGCSARCDDVDCSDGFLGKKCVCYCEGKDTPIKNCRRKDDCPNPSINEVLFGVLDKEYFDADMNLTHYPDKTVLNVYSKNKNCSIVSQFECDNGKWRGHVPDCPVQLGLQFVDGSTNEGIVEIVLNEQHGYICDDDWDDNDANVACRMMGFKFGKARYGSRFKVKKSLPILLEDVKCTGSEFTLSECMFNVLEKHDCTYEEVVAVTCFYDIPIKNIDVVSEHDCGRIPLYDSKRRKREARILGGSEAVTGMNPWQAQIQIHKEGSWQHLCGGTIISSHWILSAAHCFEETKAKYEDVRVNIGDNDRIKKGDHEQGFRIEYLVKHRQYNKIKDTFINDIALLRIKSETSDGAIFNDYVQPACLPEENEPLNYGKKCEVSGWGRLKGEGELPEKLMSVEVHIVDERKCKKHYGVDSQSVFCAGDKESDACRGDSGGPLVCKLNEKSIVYGITSYGQRCGLSDSPGVYVNVAAYVSWIKQKITLHDSDSLPDGFLLFTDSNQKQIYRMDMATQSYVTIPLSGHDIPFAIDYDYIDGRIYWTDVGIKQIRSASINGNSEKTVMTLDSESTPIGIAVDSKSRLIFYTDAGKNKIYVVTLDGSASAEIINSDLDKPIAIIADPDKTKLYWSDSGHQPKIETSNYDGTNRRIIIQSYITWPNAITVDNKAGILYWADESTNRIEKANLDGTNRVVLHRDIQANYIGLTLYMNTLYYTDWQENTVMSLPTSGGPSTHFGPPGIGKLNDIHVHKNGYNPSGINGCTNGNGGCSHICLPNSGGGKTCICTTGMSLQQDGINCGNTRGSCGQPKPVANAVLKPTFRNTETFYAGEVVEYDCAFGYSIKGRSRTRTCINGRWSIVSFSCDLQGSCVQPPPVANAVLKSNFRYKETFNTGEVVEYDCALGYSITGRSRKRTCYYGRWSSVSFSCSPRGSCGQPQPVANAVLKPTFRNTEAFNVGEFVEYDCALGYSIKGRSRKRICYYGRWSSVRFSCDLITCPYVPPPEHGRRLDRNNGAGEYTEFGCITGYEMKGPKTLLCKTDGKWTPRRPPICERHRRVYFV